MKIWKVVLSFVRRHPGYSAFPLVFAIILYLNIPPRDYRFYYDSGQYWELRNSFVRHGVFSLLNYHDQLRGYLFPLINYSLSVLARSAGVADYIGYEAAMSFVYAGFLTVLVPGLVELIFNRQPGIFPILTFSSVAVAFWRGSFFYPLSDLLAFLFLLAGTFIAMKFHRHWWPLFLTGMFWGGAAVIRPPYEITLPALFLWAVYYYRRELSLVVWPILFRLLSILVGLIFVFTPQMIINIVHFEIFSPFVPAQRAGGENEFLWQLGNGIEIQKYETNVGTTYPNTFVFFRDRQGESVLIRSGYKAVATSVSGDIGPDRTLTIMEYIKLVFDYLPDMISIYARHLFNGLDVVYNTVYVTDIFGRALVLRFVNYSIWFLVIIYIAHIMLRLDKRKYLGSASFLPVIFSLPSILSIPTAIEVRYMLPVHLMAYALVAFWVLPEFAVAGFVQKKNVILRHITWYILFVILCFMLSSNTYAGLNYGSYLLAGSK